MVGKRSVWSQLSSGRGLAASTFTRQTWVTAKRRCVARNYVLKPKVRKKNPRKNNWCRQGFYSWDHLIGTKRWPFKNTIPSWVSLASSLDCRVTSRGGCLRRHIHPRWINLSDVNKLKDRKSLKLRGVLHLKCCFAALPRTADDVLPLPGRLVI